MLSKLRVINSLEPSPCMDSSFLTLENRMSDRLRRLHMYTRLQDCHDKMTNPPSINRLHFSEFLLK
jgi:hypothetical protein